MCIFFPLEPVVAPDIELLKGEDSSLFLQGGAPLPSQASNLNHLRCFSTSVRDIPTRT